MSRPYSELAARIRVPAGFLLGLVYLVFTQPAQGRLLRGAAVAFVGLLLRAASTGYLEKDRKLATSGPYAYTRNPLYLGTALSGVGFCIAGGHWWFFLLLGIFLAGVYWPVIRQEEAHLSKLFPKEFDAYVRSVPMLLPRLLPSRKKPAAAERFCWELYWRNREYQAFLAYIVIILSLLIKMSLTGGR